MITVCSVTGVDLDGHLEAIQKTQAAIPHYTKHRLHFVPGMTLAEYSVFIVLHLSELISTEHVLICQPDGFGRYPKNWTDDFLAFDYVGAVWNWPPFVGNGGCSLRSKRFLELCSELPVPDCPEDIHVCCHFRGELESKGMKFAPVEISKRFSFEHPLESDPSWTPEMAWAFHGKHHLQNQSLGL